MQGIGRIACDVPRFGCGRLPPTAALSDLETAAIEQPLRATSRLLRTLTREQTLDAEDMRAVLAAGVSREQIEDALAVGFAFNTILRPWSGTRRRSARACCGV